MTPTLSPRPIDPPLLWGRAALVQLVVSDSHEVLTQNMTRATMTSRRRTFLLWAKADRSPRAGRFLSLRAHCNRAAPSQAVQPRRR